MTPALLAVLLATAPAASEPPPIVGAFVGGAAAVTGTLVATGAGAAMITAAQFSDRQEVMTVFGALALASTPLITALAAGVALNVFYGGELPTWMGVVATAFEACVMAYLCGAAVALLPLLALGGGNCGSPGNCGGLNGDPCGGANGAGGRNNPRDEVMGGIYGAGIGLAVGGVLGFFFPIAINETTGGSVIGGVAGVPLDPVIEGVVLGGALAVVTSGIGSAIGVAISGPEKSAPKKTEAKAARRSYEILPRLTPVEAALAF